MERIRQVRVLRTLRTAERFYLAGFLTEPNTPVPMDLLRELAAETGTVEVVAKVLESMPEAGTLRTPEGPVMEAAPVFEAEDEYLAEGQPGNTEAAQKQDIIAFVAKAFDVAIDKRKNLKNVTDQAAKVLVREAARRFDATLDPSADFDELRRRWDEMVAGEGVADFNEV